MKKVYCILMVLVFSTAFTSAQSGLITQFVSETGGGASSPKAYGWNWLYTGVWGAGSNTNIGLDGTGIWCAGIILDLSAHIGDSITKVAWYHGDSAVVTGKIYTGDYTNPLVLVGQTDPMTYTTSGWKQNNPLQTSVLIQPPGLYWVVLDIQDPGVDHYPLGSRTPLNTNAGKISTNGTTWNDLSFHNLDFSWLIGAFVYSLCPPPKTLASSNIGPYSATVSWVPQGITASWDVEYGPSGFTQGTGQTGTSNINNLNLTGLNHSTQYDFYVRGVCSVADTSMWEGPGTFATAWVNDSADFKSYYFGHGGEIDVVDYPHVKVTLPGNPNLSNLTASFVTSTGVKEVKVGGIDQINGSTPNNFYTPVVYSIMAEDSVTVKNWIVIVNGHDDISVSETSQTMICPNPCRESFYLYTDKNCTMEVFDMNGTLKFSQQIESVVTSIETTGLKSGVYLIRLSDQNAVNVLKLMVY